MTVTVSVDATWRMNRVEFFAPHAPHGTITGYGEILLEEPAEPTPGGGLLRQFTRTVSEPQGGKTYGVMPAEAVTRKLADVMEETVEVDGQTITFAFAMAAMKAFMEQWRVEDAETPAPQMTLPEGSSETVSTPPQPPTPFAGDVLPPDDFGGDIPPPPPPKEGEVLPAPPKPPPREINPLPA